MPTTRLAPSPTGYLHLGHVVNALYVRDVARALQAKVLVRIEDHDRMRCRPEYERALLEDLAWLGFIAPDASFVRQSDRHDIYLAALERLRHTAHVYACDCSRADIRRRSGNSASSAGEDRYDGYCRARGLDETPDRGLRVELGSGSERFADLLLGEIEQSPHAQCGDMLIRDRDGHWTYQFAVTVDDLDQNVDVVIRGADLLDSTARQIRLGQLLGRKTPPAYLHHPLIVKASGDKLSKADNDSGIREMRERGDTPWQVMARAAAAVGLTEPTIDARILRSASAPGTPPAPGSRVPTP